MIEETLESLLEELGKHQDLDMNTKANRICMGLLLLVHRSEYEFKVWAPDAPSVFAEAWRKRGRIAQPGGRCCG